MTISKYICVGLITSLGLSACATTLPSHVGLDHRASIEDANNKQIVSKTAVKGAPILHPEMSAAAIQRYLDDAVKEPEVTGGFSSDGEGAGSN